MSYRLEQINDLIKQELAKVIQQELEMPADVLVSVTEVKTNKDLKRAKIGVSVFPFARRQEIFSFILKRIKRLQYFVHQKITFKYSPVFWLYLDETEQKADEVLKTLDEIKNKKS